MLPHLIARAHNGVTGATLLGLKNKLHAGLLDSGADFLGLMADDYVDFFRGNHVGGSIDHMGQ